VVEYAEKVRRAVSTAAVLLDNEWTRMVEAGVANVQENAGEALLGFMGVTISTGLCRCFPKPWGPRWADVTTAGAVLRSDRAGLPCSSRVLAT
jgi:hypothetical protein